MAVPRLGSCVVTALLLLLLLQCPLVPLRLARAAPHAQPNGGGGGETGGVVREPRAHITRPYDREFLLGDRGSAMLLMSFVAADVDRCGAFAPLPFASAPQ